MPLNSDVSSLESFLKNLGPREEIEWELELSELARDEEFGEPIEELWKRFSVEEPHQPPPGKPSDSLNFSVFYLYVLYTLEENRSDEAEEVLLRKNHLYKDYPLYHHLRARIHSKQMEYPQAKKSIEKAVTLMNEQNFSHPGIKHNYAIIIMKLAYSSGEIFSIDESLKAEINDSINLVEEAIEEFDHPEYGESYPKYKVTHGMALALKENFKEAKTKILQGKEGEKPSNKEKINEYQSQLTRVEVIETGVALKNEINQQKNEIDDQFSEFEGTIGKIRTETLQFLGFFAALLTVVLAGANATFQADPRVLGQALMILFGGQIIAFAGFSTMLNKDLEDVLGMALIGGILVAGGVYLLLDAIPVN